MRIWAVVWSSCVIFLGLTFYFFLFGYLTRIGDLLSFVKSKKSVNLLIFPAFYGDPDNSLSCTGIYSHSNMA
jgi:hypothetical protein